MRDEIKAFINYESFDSEEESIQLKVNSGDGSCCARSYSKLTFESDRGDGDLSIDIQDDQNNLKMSMLFDCYQVNQLYHLLGSIVNGYKDKLYYTKFDNDVEKIDKGYRDVEWEERQIMMEEADRHEEMRRRKEKGEWLESQNNK